MALFTNSNGYPLVNILDWPTLFNSRLLKCTVRIYKAIRVISLRLFHIEEMTVFEDTSTSADMSVPVPPSGRGTISGKTLNNFKVFYQKVWYFIGLT